jgi:hypothetical protein
VAKVNELKNKALYVISKKIDLNKRRITSFGVVDKQVVRVLFGFNSLLSILLGY